jgi:putative tricarboxylic transport membrane protein
MLASPTVPDRESKSRVRREQQVACVCLLGVFLAALAISLNYPFSDALGPGPGFFPAALAILGAVLAIVILMQVTRGELASEPTAALPRGRAAWQTASAIVALASATALLELVGYRLVMAAFIVVMLLVLGARSPVAVLLTALAGSLGIFHVFYYWLKVPLPIGVFGI